MAGLQADVRHVQRGDAPQMSQVVDVATVTGVVHAVDAGLAVPTHQVLLGRHQGHGQVVVVGVGDGEIEEDGREPRVLAVERDKRAEGFQPHLHGDRQPIHAGQVGQQATGRFRDQMVADAGRRLKATVFVERAALQDGSRTMVRDGVATGVFPGAGPDGEETAGHVSVVVDVRADATG